ncbi:RLA class II histocompatibility antigen, DP alpha-1 chain-like [Cottoperca gobio]|uniref:RLA class II histocompatibility antigen, DP alpha-1 chain-like n=1 Tax=Cottoperca gobio TaxID=56716 RepID=A0A6J2PCK1_COTGO|nr:RLA class II histocompatibility antigen, DP alpha-1 chain-like [Cottoperca gobio]
MMKMMLVLVLSGLLCVSADVQHKDFALTGCSDSDGEDLYALDDEVIWYADFQRRTGVEPQPSFVDHITYPGAYELAEANLKTCQGNLKNTRKAFKDFPLEKDAPSTPVVYTKEEMDPGEKNVLICHVTGFYPAPVTFSWTKNGENVTEGASISVPFVNKDGSFNQFSRLDFIPQLGDVYSCGVKHLALDKPLTRIWDVEKPQPSIGPAVFCGLGLTVGLLGVAAGTFFLIKGNECS